MNNNNSDNDNSSSEKKSGANMMMFNKNDSAARDPLSGTVNPSLASGAPAAGDPEELTMFVKDLLQQMQSKFATMGDSIIGRVDEMGSRIDDLEKSIAELMEQAGMEPPNQQAIITAPPRDVHHNSNSSSANA